MQRQLGTLEILALQSSEMELQPSVAALDCDVAISLNTLLITEAVVLMGGKLCVEITTCVLLCHLFFLSDHRNCMYGVFMENGTAHGY